MAQKLLLADDSVTIRRVIELTFADEDIHVTTVGDGQQAIDRILSDRPDIVLADAGMPERDGFEVATFIKSDPDLRHIPVLLLTGAFEPVDEQRVRAAGCDGVLAKPFEPQLLIARVKELLGVAKKGRRSGDPLTAPMVTPPPAPPPESRPSAGPRTLADLCIPADVRLAAEKIYGTAAREAERERAPAPVEFDRVPDLADFPEPPPAPEPREADPPRTMASARLPAEAHAAAGWPVASDLWPPSPRAAEPEPFVAGAAPALPPPAVPVTADEMALPSLAPAQEPGSSLSLDEYFDQLDAAFATMTPPPEPKTAPPSRPVGESWAGGPADAEWIQQIVRERVNAGVPAGPAAQPPADVPPTVVPPAPAAPLSAAFSALLAVEQGEEVSPEVMAVTGISPVPVDALVEDVTRRVVERLADRAVREQVADIVSAVAERLVREEIQRLKAKL
jgi:CheY-like chemotaxis protein